ILLLLARVGLVAGITFLATHVHGAAAPSEPSYQGRILTEWVQLTPYPQPTQIRSQAAVAIRRIGTTAIPCLLGWVQGESEPSEKAVPMFEVFRRDLPDHVKSKHEIGYAGLAVLGPMAQSAVPQLTALFKQKRGDLDQRRILDTFEAIGRPALASVLYAVTNGNLQISQHALAIASKIGNGDPAIVRLILQKLDPATVKTWEGARFIDNDAFPFRFDKDDRVREAAEKLADSNGWMFFDVGGFPHPLQP
ncbi:MAG: hypothetical protein NTW03_17170, partial [Verrucomicrobia bacterium]|nr:hypothetical protein [Verrucomicrobiota bacterium]